MTPWIIYAGTNNGVFKSANAGENWISVNSDMFDGTWIYTLSVDPVTPATLYAGPGNFVFVSTNGGEAWGFTVVNDHVRALVIAPVTPTTLYAGTESFIRSLMGLTIHDLYRAGSLLTADQIPVRFQSRAGRPGSMSLARVSDSESGIGFQWVRELFTLPYAIRRTCRI